MKLEQLIEHRDAAYWLALRVTGRPEAAEDAVQEACLKAVRAFDPAFSPPQARAWFLTVVANEARMILRAEARRDRKEAEVPVSDPSGDGDDRGELATAARAALGALEEKFRLPLHLCYEQGLSRAEAAGVLGMPERTLSHRIGEGLERLRQAMGRTGFAVAPAVLVAGLQAAPAMAAPAKLAAAVEAILTGGAGAGAVGAVGAGGASVAAAAKAGLGAKLALGLAAAALAAGAVAVVAVTREAPSAGPATIYDDRFSGGTLDGFWAAATPPDGVALEGRLILRIAAGTGSPRSEIVSRPIRLEGRALEVSLEHGGYSGNSDFRKNGLELVDDSGRMLCRLERTVGDDGPGGYRFEACGGDPAVPVPQAAAARGFALRLDPAGRAELLGAGGFRASARASAVAGPVRVRLYEEMRWGNHMTWQIDRVSVRREEKKP